MMSSAGDALGQRLVEVGGQAVAVAVDDAGLEPLLDRPAAAVLLLRLGHGHVGEDVEQRRPAGRSPVGLVAAVVDQVEADLDLLLGDLVERHDAGRVHDRRVEPGLDALVQEHRVEHVAGGGVEAEAHVGHAERGVDARAARP